MAVCVCVCVCMSLCMRIKVVFLKIHQDTVLLSRFQMAMICNWLWLIFICQTFQSSVINNENKLVLVMKAITLGEKPF